MIKMPSTFLLLGALLAAPAQAQQHIRPAEAQQHLGLAQPSPYAGFQTRSIKSLSDQQMDDLKTGRGMGLALAAELNGYPGPKHVIELQDALGLTDSQRTRMTELFNAMDAEVIPLGERIIAQEKDLDQLFAKRTVTPASLAASTREIGLTQAALREAHLKYHLSTVEVLSPEQVRRYLHLRGYATR